MPTPPPKKDEASKTPENKDKTKKEKEKEHEHDEDILDDALDDTFPASDPIAPQDPGRPGRD